MSITKYPQAIPDEVVVNKILRIRDQNVMLDSDLAELYGTTTKRLKEQVRRNIIRFPKQYMFELTDEEFELLRSQSATSNKGRGGARYRPMVFTEHGVLQVSNVLTSDRAIQVGFRVIDVFVKLREMLSTTTELKLDIEYIKKRLNNHDQTMEVLFSYFDEEAQKKEKPPVRKSIGYKLKSGSK